MASNLINLDDTNFREEALESKIPVLVDFHAEWCGPCKMMAPFVDQLADELQGKVKVAKLDIDKARETATRYGITGVPTLILFKEGKVLAQQIGALPKVQLKNFVKQVL